MFLPYVDREVPAEAWRLLQQGRCQAPSLSQEVAGQALSHVKGGEEEGRTGLE